jgi:hypothetical protein
MNSIVSQNEVLKTFPPSLWSWQTSRELQRKLEGLGIDTPLEEIIRLVRQMRDKGLIEATFVHRDDSPIGFSARLTTRGYALRQKYANS